MTYLTASNAVGAKYSYRYYVELASDELDHERVPVCHRLVDVVVLSNKLEAIKAVITAAGYLSGYTIVACWIRSDCALVLNTGGWGNDLQPSTNPPCRFSHSLELK